MTTYSPQIAVRGSSEQFLLLLALSLTPLPFELWILLAPIKEGVFAIQGHSILRLLPDNNS